MSDAPPLFDTFCLRCEARAILVAAGADLHDAVDELQAVAVAYGLVSVVGQDVVRQIISNAFCLDQPASDIWPPPNWNHFGPHPLSNQRKEEIERAVTDAWAGRAPRHRDGAAQSGVDAAIYVLRTEGEAALASNDHLMVELSSKQIKHVMETLSRLQCSPAIAELLAELVS
jgi:hypothetical protein